MRSGICGGWRLFVTLAFGLTVVFNSAVADDKPTDAKAAENSKADATYSKHIAAILDAKCVSCHRAGEIGPFALDSFEQAVSHGKQIKAVVSDGRMPPWFANPEHGKFKNDCRLSAEEKDLISAWADNGCPQGGVKDVPAKKTWTLGWQIGEPDQIVKIEKYSVPATGDPEVKEFKVDPGWTEGKWIQAVEARPGSRAVVSQVVVIVEPPATGRGGARGLALPGTGRGGTPNLAALSALNRGGRGGARSGGGSSLLDGIIDQMLDGLAESAFTTFSPGYTGTVHEPGTAYFMPAGSKLNFQVLYTPNGTAAEDESQVGIKFATADSVKKKFHLKICSDPLMQIPPGAANHEVKSRVTIREDQTLLSMAPVMRLRGKSVRYEIVSPAEAKEVLLDIPKYDPNWQIEYKLAEPKLLKNGTVIEVKAVFDNSKDNPRNPNPDATIPFGVLPTEDMMVGFYTTVMVRDDALPGSQPPRGGARGGFGQPKGKAK